MGEVKEILVKKSYLSNISLQQGVKQKFIIDFIGNHGEEVKMTHVVKD